MTDTPIADYALISDCHSAALVSISGSIDWLCYPRFDGPSMFGGLLGDEAGHWSLRPAAFTGSITRRYLENSMVLETTFRTDSGVAVLTDAMALDPSEHGHDLGAGAPGAVLRRIECTHGSVELEMEFAPRPEYGLIHPLLTAVDGGVTGRGGGEVLALSSSVGVEVDAATARARFALVAGDSAAFALQRRSVEDDPPPIWSGDEIARRVGSTADAWRRWSDVHQAYDGPWKDFVY